jgi:hypothetical protein
MRASIGQSDDAGARALCGGIADGGDCANPFEAFLGRDRFTVALLLLVERAAIAR